ncbi:MAG: RNA polymerase sigma factor [Clostridiales bacterium]|nr:RNA polymerase sigma factor [Clostridiales bacterium]
MNLETLYTACFHKLYCFALSLTCIPAEAEEIVQETFLRALQHANKLPDDANLDAWLFRIARNVHISRLRKRQREVGDDALDVVPSGESIEDQLMQQDQALHILRTLHTLDEPYKEVFTLRALGDVAYPDIAALFGKSDSWARVTYHRARLMLTERINKEGTL